MNKENQERIFKVYDEVLDSVVRNLIHTEESLKGKPLGRATTKGVETIASALKSQTRRNMKRKFRHALTHIPDSQVGNLEAEMRSGVFHLKKLLTQLARSLPKRPGGNPRKLTNVQQRGVIRQVEGLHKKGLKLRDAQRDVATNYQVSLRTVQRIWEKRSTF